MKNLFSLIIVSMFALSLMAEKYTIVFNSNENGDGSSTENLSALVYTATNNCIDSLIFANKIARAKPGFGIKGGTGDTKGELAIRLNATYHIDTMTIFAAAYVPADGADTANAKRLLVYDKEIAWETNHRSEIRPYGIKLNKDLDSIFIASKVKTKNRWYVQKIEFEANNPRSTQPIIEMQYATLVFEPVSWVSADEPMEDALDFVITGKNIQGDISLSLKHSKPFTVMPVAMPATGGDGSVSYSITMSAAPEYAINFKDTIIATATGTNSTTG